MDAFLRLLISTQYVAQQLKVNLKYLDFQGYYNKHMAYDHRERILLLIHWQPFEQEVFEHQIELLVEQQLMPRKILYQTQEYLFRQGMEAPAYDKYRKVITQALLSSSKRINQSLEKYLTAECQLVLDEFLGKDAPSQRIEIVQYKIINQATNPKSIKHNLELFLRLQDRVFRLAPLIEQLKLSDATIDYHAHWVGIAEVYMLRIHSDKYLFLLCFLIRQVLWNYLYLSELVSKLESQPELEELFDIIRNSTAVAWSHVNLLGVYDFTKLLNNSQLRFGLQN
jgi:hypothetical protein